MTKRIPMTPPDLAGFSPVQLVGSGGYADVFLYDQHMPTRQVAVKVLAPATIGGMKTDSFTSEANLMARVSAHPYIVQIFQASVSADGRPYLVMEYYPGPNYYDRARREQMAVAEVLRTGIQLASAVETAHRAGILHRDIKPANILTSEFRRPGLTDFGIASAQGPDADAMDGLSIPWSPPESFGSAVLDVRSDVYSLSATLYTLLTGRSPFEIAGGDNSGLSLISRIERSPAPPIGRADVPPSLERLLANAMSKNPLHRPASAIELARMLQGIESELKLSGTALELAEDARSVRSRVDVFDDDSTRIKGITELHAQPGAPLIDDIPVRPGVDGIHVADRRREGLLAEPEVSDTVVRRQTSTTAATEPAPSGWSRGRVLTLAGTSVAVVAAVIAFVVMSGGSASQSASTTAAADVNDNIGAAQSAIPPPPVAKVTGSAGADGTFAFTWTPPTGVGLQYAVTDDGSDVPKRIATTTYTGTVRCVQVETISTDGLVSDPVRGCAP